MKRFIIFIIFANQNIRNLFVYAVLLLIIRNHNFCLEKKKNSNNGNHGCQLYLKQKAHSRLIKLMEFSTELRKSKRYFNQESYGFVL